MMMEGLLNPHAHYNASSLVLVVADLIAAYVIWLGAHRNLRKRKIKLRKILTVPYVRISVGAVICLVGIAVGSIMWLPAFPLIISGNVKLSDWYIQVATWPANIANMTSVVGMSIIMWPMLKARFGDWALAIVVVGTYAIYLFGIIGSLVLGEWLKP